MTGGRPRPLEDLRDLVASVEPAVPAHERLLPVDPAFESLLPSGGLRRGTVLWVGGAEGAAGATTVALGLIAGPTRQGSWVGALSVTSVGWAAAAQLGVDLHRLAVVQAAGSDWSVAAAALVDTVDVVLCGPDHRPTRSDVLRLAARARERGAVVVAFGDAEAERAWPGSDLRLHVRPGAARWDGVGQGWGRLRHRRVQVTVGGRHGADRPRTVELWSPGPDGRVAVSDGLVAVSDGLVTVSDGLVAVSDGVVPFPASPSPVSSA